jgi:hypothetical protein
MGRKLKGAKARSNMQSATLNAYHAHTPRASDTFVPFDPRAYLKEYYSHLGNENRALLHFLDESYARIFTEISAARMLEFGGGPTIYQLISAAKYAVSIDFSEYLDANLNEVQLWLRDAQGQFFWDSFIRYVLDREGVHPHPGAVAQRRQLIRSKIERLIYCDAKEPDPLGPEFRSPYDIVSVNFVLESITTDMAEWNVFVEHVAPLVRPQGYLLMCAIMGASAYRVGQLYFPAVPISPEIMETKLKQQHFSIVLTHSIEAEHKDEQGYDGIFMVLARKEPV